MRVAGYFDGVMGTGEHGRQLLAALRAQEVPVSPIKLTPEGPPEDPALSRGLLDGANASPDASGGPFDRFNLLAVNADQVEVAARGLGSEFFSAHYSIGYWFWEVSEFPERFDSAFAPLDEIWVGSRHVCRAVRARSPLPVVAVPQPVSLPDSAAQASYAGRLPSGFRFLFAFDYLSIFNRKNPLAVVVAFSQSFPPGSGAALILKAMNPERDRAAHARLRAAAAAHPDIHLIERRLSREDRDGLMNAADCYVSLHRAEGFGYTLAESMWLGKPVIATAYSGNLDFMTPDNSYLVNYREVPIGPGNDPYPAGGTWAEPDVEHAARLMREVFDDPEAARRRGARAAQDIRATNGVEAAGRAMRARLESLRGVTVEPRSAPAGAPLENTADLIRRGPTQPGRQRFGAAQRAARQGLLRLVKPVTHHQRLVDSELLEIVRRLDGEIDRLRRGLRERDHRIARLEADLVRLGDPRQGASPPDGGPKTG